MPGFDGSGPRGSGPMTGRGGGYCIGPAFPGNPEYQGFGRRSGPRRGVRRRIGSTGRGRGGIGYGVGRGGGGFGRQMGLGFRDEEWDGVDGAGEETVEASILLSHIKGLENHLGSLKRRLDKFIGVQSDEESTEESIEE